MPDTKKLPPCPFCGEAEKLMLRHETIDAWVLCRACDAEGPHEGIDQSLDNGVALAMRNAAAKWAAAPRRPKK